MRALTAQTYVSGGTKLLYDFVAPSADQPLPWIVFLHGGGWVSGDRSMYYEEASWFAERGFASICLSYRLAPLHPFPSAVSDIKAALAHIKGRAEELGLDPEQGSTFGNSAGGHLSLMAALPLPGIEHGEESVKAAVALCPITDLRNPRETHFPISFSFLEQFIPELDLPSGEAVLSLASPAVHVAGLQSHLFIGHGTADDIVPVSQSQTFSQAAKKAAESKGLEVIYQELPDEGHSFTWPAWSRLRDESLTFLRRSLG